MALLLAPMPNSAIILPLPSPSKASRRAPSGPIASSKRPFLIFNNNGSFKTPIFAIEPSTKISPFADVSIGAIYDSPEGIFPYSPG